MTGDDVSHGAGDLHVQRLGDELLLTVTPDEAEVTVVCSLPIPGGVRELVEALVAEAGGEVALVLPGEVT